MDYIFSDEVYLKKLEKYENLETLKPSLMFILYTKDMISLNNILLSQTIPIGGLKGKKIEYQNVLKMPELNLVGHFHYILLKIIEEYK